MEARSNSPGARVLVVEDEEAMTEVFTETLERLGIVVVAESDPRRVLESFKNGEHYDVVVLDLRLPYVCGLALLEQIRRDHPDLPVIVVTGYPSTESVQRCRELGVLHYMRKPFEPEELSRQVRRALSPPRSAAPA